MWQETPPKEPQSEHVSPSSRLGDVAAMLRVMRPLNGTVADPVLRRRRLLADLCRLVGVSVGSVDPESVNGAKTPTKPPAPADGAPANDSELSPRMEQTLRHLLDGSSEKEVARKLSLSRHTVHVYVKALYRRFAVSSRAELLAKHFKR